MPKARVVAEWGRPIWVRSVEERGWALEKVMGGEPISSESDQPPDMSESESCSVCVCVCVAITVQKRKGEGKQLRGWARGAASWSGGGPGRPQGTPSVQRPDTRHMQLRISPESCAEVVLVEAIVSPRRAGRAGTWNRGTGPPPKLLPAAPTERGIPATPPPHCHRPTPAPPVRGERFRPRTAAAPIPTGRIHHLRKTERAC